MLCRFFARLFVCLLLLFFVLVSKWILLSGGVVIAAAAVAVGIVVDIPDCICKWVRLYCSGVVAVVDVVVMVVILPIFYRQLDSTLL